MFHLSSSPTSSAVMFRLPAQRPTILNNVLRANAAYAASGAHDEVQYGDFLVRDHLEAYTLEALGHARPIRRRQKMSGDTQDTAAEVGARVVEALRGCPVFGQVALLTPRHVFRKRPGNAEPGTDQRLHRISITGHVPQLLMVTTELSAAMRHAGVGYVKIGEYADKEFSAVRKVQCPQVRHWMFREVLSLCILMFSSRGLLSPEETTLELAYFYILSDPRTSANARAQIRELRKNGDYSYDALELIRKDADDLDDPEFDPNDITIDAGDDLNDQGVAGGQEVAVDDDIGEQPVGPVELRDPMVDYADPFAALFADAVVGVVDVGQAVAAEEDEDFARLVPRPLFSYFAHVNLRAAEDRHGENGNLPFGLAVEPPNEIVRNAPFDKELRGHLKLKNTSDKRLAFRIECSAGPRLLFQPSVGVIDSMKELFIYLTMPAFYYGAVNTAEDAISLVWIEAPAGATRLYREFWFDGEVIVNRKVLPIKYND